MEQEAREWTEVAMSLQFKNRCKVQETVFWGSGHCCVICVLPIV